MRERRSELKLDKIKALFYEIKLRYDIIYARKNHTDRNGVKEDHEYFEVIDQLFAEYCRRIYTQIKGVLYPLKCKIEWAKIGKYNAFFEFLTEKEGRARRLANILRNSRIL